MLIYKDCNCNAFWCAQVLGGNYCTLLGLQLFQFLHSAVKPIEFCSCNFQAPAFWFSTNAEYCLLPLVCFFAFLSNGSIIGSCLAWSSSLSSESSNRVSSFIGAGKETHRFAHNVRIVDRPRTALPEMSFLLAFSTTDSDKLFGLYKPGESNAKAFLVIFFSSNCPFSCKVK